MVRVPGLRTAAVAVVGACAIAALAAGASAHSLIGTHGAASGTVVFANTSSVQKLDPDVVTNFLDFQALRLIYDTLVTYNNKLQLTPDLATSWSFSNGGKTHHLPAAQEREVHGRHDLHLGERGGLAQPREGSEDRRCGLVVHRVGDEGRARRHLRREARCSRTRTPRC